MWVHSTSVYAYVDNTSVYVYVDSTSVYAHVDSISVYAHVDSTSVYAHVAHRLQSFVFYLFVLSVLLGYAVCSVSPGVLLPLPSSTGITECAATLHFYVGIRDLTSGPLGSSCLCGRPLTQ